MLAVLAMLASAVAQLPPEVIKAATEEYQKGGDHAVAIVLAVLLSLALVAIWRLCAYVIGLITKVFELTGTSTATAKDAANSAKENAAAVNALTQEVRRK